MIFFKKTMGIALPVLCLVSAIQAQTSRAVADKIIAVVGDQIILQSDIKNSIDDMHRQNMEVPDSAACILTQQALISKILMLQAEKDSLLTEEEVDNEWNQRLRYWRKVMGRDVSRHLHDGIRESLRERLLAIAMQEKIIGNVKITPAEVKSYFERIPQEKLAWYESELEIGQIVIYPKASADMEKYIIDEMNNYRRQILNKTAVFAQLAAKVSDDMESRQNAGWLEIDRNDNTLDPVLISNVFRLKEGELSMPVKTRDGYYLISMEKKDGDIAEVRCILRHLPITDNDIKLAMERLDTLRAKLITGTISFEEAASKYNEDKLTGSFLLSEDRDGYITLNELDQQTMKITSDMKPGEFSQPSSFVAGNSKKAVRLLYLQSRSAPHRMNLKDDYSRIARMALEEKRGIALDKWMRSKISSYYITLDSKTVLECPKMNLFAQSAYKGF